MLVHWSPQRSDRQLSYEISGETITATLDGESDTFDFSDLPDGELDVSALETTLDICPVLAARRVNGQLEVTLLKFHGPNAPVEERFPQPQQYTEEVIEIG